MSNKLWLCCSFFIKLTINLSRNKFARALANQPISAPHFFNPQQMFLVRVKWITQCEKRETLTKTCNETMLRDKLRVFVSRISPPLRWSNTVFARALANAIQRAHKYCIKTITALLTYNLFLLYSLNLIVTVNVKQEKHISLKEVKPLNRMV